MSQARILRGVGRGQKDRVSEGRIEERKEEERRVEIEEGMRKEGEAQGLGMSGLSVGLFFIPASGDNHSAHPSHATLKHLHILKITKIPKIIFSHSLFHAATQQAVHWLYF